MSNITKEYCPYCDKETKVKKYKADNQGKMDTAERLFFGVFTLGMSEMMLETEYKCLSCGNTFSEND